MNKRIKNYIQKLLEPKMFKKIMKGLGILLVALFIFEAGMFVGFHKGKFGRDWDDNFSRNFGPRGSGRMGMMSNFPENFPNSHGAIGKIIKIEYPTMIVADKDNIEKVVLISDETRIRQMREEGTKDSLKLNDYVVVIGSPNTQGQIEAKLIRILPPPIIENINPSNTATKMVPSNLPK